jgi:hypothetical protein
MTVSDCYVPVALGHDLDDSPGCWPDAAARHIVSPGGVRAWGRVHDDRRSDG